MDLSVLKQSPELYEVSKELHIVPEVNTDKVVNTLTQKRSGYLFAKRAMDLIAATGAILVLSPIFLITSLAIKIEDGGTPFFKQKRVGKDGKVFEMYKFRSMCLNAEAVHNKMKEEAGVTDVSFKLVEDPRITKVGKFIRKFSIDEFPQFFNILKGDMSLVGPRPLPVYEAAEVSDEYNSRYHLNPGLTCFWQVSGRSDVDFETRMNMDIKYIQKANIGLDIKLLLMTVPAVLTGRGAY